MGEHIIKVESDDDWDVYNNYVLTVTKDEKIKFDVCCTRNGIEIGLSGEVAMDNTTDDNTLNNNNSSNEEKEDTPSSNENTTAENDDSSVDAFDPYDYAVIVCQSIKDSLYNPDSIQIHKVYYIDAYWHNYYVDFSAMNQVGGYTRESYEALFNKDSSLYKFNKVYDLPDIFEEYDYEKLDVDVIESNLK